MDVGLRDTSIGTEPPRLEDKHLICFCSRGVNLLTKRSAILVLGFVVTVALSMPATAHANTITYSNSLTFQAALGASVTDNYSAAGYQQGDVYENVFSNAAMSAVIGETDYQTTGWPNWNILQGSGNSTYCAGCNGSFRLTFNTTSVGTASGVYGAGFNFVNTKFFFRRTTHSSRLAMAPRQTIYYR